MEDLKQETKKVDTKISNTNIAPVEKENIFDLLAIEEQENEQAFLSHTIIAKISGYRLSRDENDRVIKCQIQNKMIDKDTGALINFTFTLNAEAGIIKENEVKGMVGKTIKVIDIVRYTDINKNSMGQEISREHRYGGQWANMIVIPNSNVESYELNSFVNIDLTSVSNALKKGNPTGDVKLISIKTENDGSVKTFECKLKHNKIGKKLDKAMFKPVLGRKIRINKLTDSRINGTTYYSTEDMPALA